MVVTRPDRILVLVLDPQVEIAAQAAAKEIQVELSRVALGISPGVLLNAFVRVNISAARKPFLCQESRQVG